MWWIGIDQDEKTLQGLLKLLSNPVSRIKLVSGYLNPSQSTLEHLLESKSELEILTASPPANSFYKGGLFKKYIPALYRQIEYNLLERANKIGKKLTLSEYILPESTFHSKGLWLYEKGDKFPVATVFGSSNFSK